MSQTVNQMLVRVLSWMPMITAFLIPIHPRFTSLTLALWTVVSLTCFFANLIARNRDANRLQISFLLKLFGGASLLYFVAICMGMLWTEELSEGWFALEVKFSFFLLPLLFWQLNSLALTHSWKSRSSRAFQAGLLTYLAWRFFEAIWIGDWSLMRYDGFAGPFHPSYMALYMLTGILLSSAQDLLGKVVVIFGGLAIGILASKAGWGIGILVLGIESLRRFKVAQNEARWLLASMLLLISGAWWADGGRMQEFQSYLGQGTTAQVSSNDGLQSMNSNTMINASEAPIVVKTGSTGGRMQAWNAALQLLQSNPFGVGTGDITSSLLQIYEHDGSLYAKEKNMNPHSIWLQIGVRLGWLALLGMFLFFITFMWKALQVGGFEIAIWTLAVAMNGTVESLFELQQGVVAILFFGLLLSSGSEVNEEAQIL